VPRPKPASCVYFATFPNNRSQIADEADECISIATLPHDTDGRFHCNILMDCGNLRYSAVRLDALNRLATSQITGAIAADKSNYYSNSM
jgi:hypothetical protein